jgi:hypothetical protein
MEGQTKAVNGRTDKSCKWKDRQKKKDNKTNTKHHTENYRSFNMNPTKNWG